MLILLMAHITSIKRIKYVDTLHFAEILGINEVLSCGAP